MRSLVWLSCVTAGIGCGDVLSGNDDAGVNDSGSGGNDGREQLDSGAEADAAPDPVSFEIAYVNRVDVGPTIGIGAPFTGLIINISDRPLDLTTMQFVSSQDDHPQAVFTAVINNPSTVTAMPPGEAHGQLTPLGAQPLVEPLVSEPWTDTSRPTIDWNLASLPSPLDQPINASAILRVEEEEITLTWRFEPGTDTTFLEAIRTRAAP